VATFGRIAILLDALYMLGFVLNARTALRIAHFLYTRLQRSLALRLMI